MPDPSSSTPIPKAIGSLAKKQNDVTRQGTQKLKFVPTLPQRRKKEEVKPEPSPTVIPPASQSDRGRGRGRGDGRGRGRGRGGAPSVVEMTASGPFAMGPALAGNNARRSTPRSAFAPTGPIGILSSSAGGGLSQTGPPSLRKNDTKNGPVKTEEDEVYSDPDEGVEIIDMDNVRQMDWMAPESLRKERESIKKVKKEEQADDIAAVNGDPDNALNLSESEAEEELEDIMEDFATQATLNMDESLREERLYFFQFPSPFPTFTTKNATPMEVDQVVPVASERKVSFAPDVKPGVNAESRTPSVVPTESPESFHVDGVIGQLEVYKSGAVKMRLANGTLLDVNAASQPSFLQQVVHLDKAGKQLTVLGEVNKQFVVSPNVDALLIAVENASRLVDGEEKLFKMES
ncbi:RNA polymerase III RPC4-domain-containing protein [Gymnopilus junonius]|uniref:RNA polymerase III RPC4-domain-containing protein n=1 Tax=Gymnopilus junonius TaxID=109634 RepID=A0A9P5NWV1_GYMJU|nr:RNA polymerase III RPC4-domain-containing protein [Gymnopilus junonius]